MEQEQEPDCPICLEAMSPADFEHPLQCTRNCGFNFCSTCIENLIKSSKDDYCEASDGNNHVKIFLHCPKCRSDLDSSMRDTLLLRKARTLELHSGTSDAELTATDLHLKRVLYEDEVQKAIKEARRREAAFFGRKSEEDDNETDDEKVIGPDVATGVPESFRFHEKLMDSPYLQRRTIDPTLYPGLECIMTKEEQLVVTELMTSGETNKLAAAAELLHNITIMVQKGIARPKPLQKPQHNRQSSIYDLIEESKMASQKANEKAASPPAATARKPLAARQPLVRPNEKVAQHRALEHEIHTRSQFMILHPLPVRMPKFVEFNLHDESSLSFLPIFRSSDTCPLTFCDDAWDGSVIDAFSKISISFSGETPVVSKTKSEHLGVRNVLLGSGTDVAEQIDTEKGRVLVASVTSEGGRQGVVKGDVVTHFNGEEFDGTADDLDAAIKACADRSATGTFTLILNAERSIAEALKRRAMV